MPKRMIALHRHVDRFGSMLSGACALHCVTVPILFALVPTLSLALHAHQHPAHRWAIALLHLSRWEIPLSASAAGLAMTSTWLGRRSHDQTLPLSLAVLGTMTLFCAIVWPVLVSDALLHGIAMFAGGACLMAAHLCNRASLRGQVRYTPGRSPVPLDQTPRASGCSG